MRLAPQPGGIPREKSVCGRAQQWLRPPALGGWVGGWVGVPCIEFPAWPLWRALADTLPRILQPPVGIWARLGRETFVSEKGGAAKLGLAAGGERGLAGDSPRSCKGCSAGISVGDRALAPGRPRPQGSVNGMLAAIAATYI